MDKTDVLTPLQIKLLEQVFADEWFRRHFYLTGGTALAAYYLCHRYSDDLDFFSHGVELASVPGLIEKAAKEIGSSARQVQTSPGFMRFLIGNELKIDVVADVGFRVGAPELIDGIMVDSIKNIAVNKVCAILGRFDGKDYVDLYMILRNGQYDIFELFSLGRQKDGGLDPFIWASLIAEVAKLQLFPRMITPLAPDELNSFFLSLREQIIDRLGHIVSGSKSE